MISAGTMKNPTNLVARPIVCHEPLCGFTGQGRSAHFSTHPLSYQLNTLGINVYDPEVVRECLRVAQSHSHPRPRVPKTRALLIQFFLVTLCMCASGSILYGVILQSVPRSLALLLLLSAASGILLSILITAYFHSLVKGLAHPNKPPKSEIVIEPITFWLTNFDLKAKTRKHCNNLLSRLPHVTFFIHHAGSEHFLMATLGDEKYYIGHWHGHGRKHALGYLHE